MSDGFYLSPRVGRPAISSQEFNTISHHQVAVDRGRAAYATLRSTSPRFIPDEPGRQINDANYNCDCGPTKTLATTMRDSSLHYTVAFSTTSTIARSPVPMRRSPELSPTRPSWSRASTKNSKTAAQGTRTQRYGEPGYQPESTMHNTLAKSVAETPIQYGNMRTRSPRFSCEPVPAYWPANLGPGAYEPHATAGSSGTMPTDMEGGSQWGLSPRAGGGGSMPSSTSPRGGVSSLRSSSSPRAASRERPSPCRSPVVRAHEGRGGGGGGGHVGYHNDNGDGRHFGGSVPSPPVFGRSAGAGAGLTGGGGGGGRARESFLTSPRQARAPGSAPPGAWAIKAEGLLPKAGGEAPLRLPVASPRASPRPAASAWK